MDVRSLVLLPLASLLVLAPADATVRRANEVRPCAGALAMVERNFASVPPAEAAGVRLDPARCRALAERMATLKDAALVYDRCVDEPDRTHSIDALIDAVFEIRRTMASSCA